MKLKTTIKKILCPMMAILLCIIGTTSCRDNVVKTDDDGKNDKKENNAVATQVSPNTSELDVVNVRITLKDDRVMEFELYPKIAPITVQNFVDLATSGFYDGLIFHRIISDFMIQGGDPMGTGMGGSDKTIKGEFSKNGVENTLKHEKGVISMARSSEYDSASSQFFICSSNSASVKNLDGSYAAFGMMTKGWKTLSDLESVKTDADDKPLTDIVIKSIRVIEK